MQKICVQAVIGNMEEKDLLARASTKIGKCTRKESANSVISKSIICVNKG